MSRSRGRDAIAAWIWEGQGRGAGLARLALAPLSALFGAGVRFRNARFDEPPGANARDVLVRPTMLPTLSVGNLTVGGTGKTPVAAWCARALRKAGRRPAIVLRGYGDDEWRVHTLLNPGVPVIAATDRLDGIAIASTQGADCAVLDDGFQHRRAARVADIVLMSADRWTGRARLLPAGPFREPLSALRRATCVVITVKAAPLSQVTAVEAAIMRAAPESAVCVVRLVLGTLHLAATLPALDNVGKSSHRRPVADELLERPVSWLAGRTLVVVSSIGDPAAFESQIAHAGATLTPLRFPDHHDFTADDAGRIVRAAEAGEGVLCTLKDAVKLAPLWPRVGPPLWYVSQSVVVERGAPALDRALARVLARR